MANGITKGWELYRRCGSPKFIVAPMVNQSELPFRALCRQYGADLCYTPMFHAKMFGLDEKYRQCFSTDAKDRPLFVQFCAHDPDTLLAAARRVEDKCDAVDINLGCPQGIARRGHYGAFLLEETELLAAMVKILDTNLAIPVTCKIRILPSEKDTLALAQMLQDSGCAILAVHGRTRDMIKQKLGPNNFDIIRKIKQQLDIPVFANGGIETLADVERCLKETGVDGVMVSEAILENPAIFSGSSPSSYEMAEEYIRLVRLYNHGTASRAIQKAIRPHLFKILFRELTVHTELRSLFAATKDHDWMLGIVDRLKAADQKLGSGKEEAYANVPKWYHRHTSNKAKHAKKAKEKALQEQKETEDNSVALNNLFPQYAAEDEEEGEDQEESEEEDEEAVAAQPDVSAN